MPYLNAVPQTAFDTRLAATSGCSELETGGFADSFRVMGLLPTTSGQNDRHAQSLVSGFQTY